jgi:hypothetical protein
MPQKLGDWERSRSTEKWRLKMSISIKYRNGTPIKGSSLNRVLLVTCESCGIQFTHANSIDIRTCPACDVTLPKRIKFLPGYHSARLRYYTNK